MRQRKKLQELTIKDNFMFGAVMMDEENCRRLLEISLGFPVAHVAVSKEKVLYIIRSIRAYVWMLLQTMKRAHILMWRCRRLKNLHWGEEADIITVRLIWSYC